MTIIIIALENFYLTVAGILAAVLAVGETLLITGIIIIYVCYCWRRRMKSVKLNKDTEQSPQDTYSTPLSSGNMPHDKIRQDEVCYFNSITNNIS